MGEAEVTSLTSSRSSGLDAQSGVLLSIVVPVLDEAESLEPLLREIDAVTPKIPGRFEVIFVDDGSSDGSWNAISAIARSRSDVRGLRFATHRGQTAALIAGIDAARGRVIAFLDADLQNDPLDLPHMIEPILAGVTDLVCGWRRSAQESAPRSLRSRIANSLIRSTFDLEIHDPGCTLRVGRKAVLEGIRLDDEMHGFIPGYAQARGARISETTVSDRPRIHGENKYAADRAGKVLVDALLGRLLTGSDSRPVVAFGRIALVLFVIGTIALCLAAWRSFAFDEFASALMLFVAMLADVAALICLMSGLLVELNVRAMRRLAGHDANRIAECTPERDDSATASV